MFDQKEIIVSCQLEYPNDYEQEIVKWMAISSHLGGAGWVRLCGAKNVEAVKRLGGNIKIIGCTKGRYDDGMVYITPTLQDVVDLFNAGADYVAVDFTMRTRTQCEVEKICCAGRIVADISTLNEGVTAGCAYNVSAIATTLSGYTKQSQSEDYKRKHMPDLHLPGLIALNLKHSGVKKPVIAEGRYWMPEQVSFAFNSGASAVCLGGVITKPTMITERFMNVQ